jgi:hypothetical protein
LSVGVCVQFDASSLQNYLHILVVSTHTDVMGM